ncbi:phage major capsid protein [Kitasatospora sp. NPDC058184]|uniref:phage major capsid protein n=1 Tax=Kitasatospora sp. NPDC058184 TaxID=3346370 RepID=UPI0036D77644
MADPKTRKNYDNMTPEQRFSDILHDEIVSASKFLGAFNSRTTNREKCVLLIGNAQPRVGVVAEGKSIPTVDVDDLTPITVYPVKWAGMDILTNEVIADSDPSVMARNTAKLSGAVAKGFDDDFLNAPKPGAGKDQDQAPAGILTGLTASGEIAATGEKANLDAVHTAKAEIEDADGSASLFVVHPMDAAELKKIKVNLGNTKDTNQYLLDDSGSIAGLTVITHKAMPKGKALIADRGAVEVIVREGTEVKLLTERYADLDSTGVRTKFRATYKVTAPKKLRLLTVPTAKADEK